MERISELLNRHDGQSAWIFGKGPSLDQFSMAEATGVKICINESVLVVPNPTYFFAHDEPPIRNVSSKWPDGCSAILQVVRGEYAEECGIPSESVYFYDKCYADNHVRDMDASRMADRGALYGNSGTVHSAIHFCRLIGASEITMVGFDGGGGYAASLDLPDGGADHDRIRRDSILLLDVMGIPYDFWQKTPAAP